MKAMLELLPKVSGAWGSGHLLQGKLFSACSPTTAGSPSAP